MKNIKKILLIMAMTMALGTSAFAASGFEFLLNVPFGMNIAFPNKETKDLGLDKNYGGFDAGVEAQIGYMFQVKEGFGISVLAELGYAWDWYNYSSESATATGGGGYTLNGSYHSLKLGLLPKFNIGVGKGTIALGIGGGVKIPAVATLRYGYGVWNADLNREEGIDEVNLKRQDILDLFSPALIGYMKFTFDYYLFFTDKIGMNFGFYLGGSFGPKVRDLKLGGNAFDFGLQLGFRFGPKA